MTRSWSYDDARWTKVDHVIAALFLLFFVYTVLVWRGVVGDGSAWRPGQTVLLSGALFTQALAVVIRRYSRPAFFALLAGSLGLIYFSLSAR